MTDIALTLYSAYLAGPMRGIEEYNFPAFHKEADWLRSKGWKIFSPAERDEADPTIDPKRNIAGWHGSRGLDYFMSFDLKAVCEHEAVILMKGWETSQGARLEAMVAVEIDHPVFEIVRGPRALRSRSTRAWKRLVSVSNARVAAEFIAGTKAYRELPVLQAYEPVGPAAEIARS